ncbi:MAG: hypothetical protein GY917_16515 [Planctomycetaceae bacterium]|nr:hypothetical protein [Planctomycetaceae bacterium]
MNPLQLQELFRLDDDGFRDRFRRSPLWRSKRRGILRNAAIVLGNQRHPSSCNSLSLGLADEEPLVRGAAAWALGQLANPLAVESLAARLPLEDDPLVISEIEQALHASNVRETPPGP